MFDFGGMKILISPHFELIGLYTDDTRSIDEGS